MKQRYTFDYLFSTSTPDIEALRRLVNIETIERMAEEEEKQVDNIKDAIK